MKRLIPIVMLAATVAGCASSSMKSTPFYEGSERTYTGRVEDRVNLWPLMYWREPALSVAWPIYSQAEDHWAIRPFYSQYRQDGKDADYDEFNFVWPFCQFDTKHDEHRIFPLFWGEDHFDVFPVFFWTKNWYVIGPYATNSWWAAGLVGTRSGAVEGEWVFPLYSRRKNVTFDGHMALLDAPCEQANKSPSFWLASGNRRSYLFLSDYDESFRAHRGWHAGGDKLMMSYRRKVGNCMLLGRTAGRTVYYDEARNVVERDDETEETSFLLVLYRAESKLDRLTHKSSASHRVLWKLWDWERQDEDVTLDVFPFFSYDAKANGYSKTSLLWRFFRYEYDPKADKRAVDFLFIPVWR